MKAPAVASIVLVLALFAAGCIAPPEDGGATGARTANRGGEMTSQEKQAEDKVALCGSGGLPSIGGDGSFCAERVIDVTGTIGGISRMDVSLASFNGDVDLTGGKEGEWSLKAVLWARGATEDEARAKLENIEFAWSHTDGSSHFLEAKAEHKSGARGVSAQISAVLPRTMALVVVAATSNGNVAVEDVGTEGLSASTSNGNVEVDASVTQVQLATSNGNIAGTLRPTASGRWDAGTSNGGISLKVPEDAAHGYEITAATSNGKVEFDLRDGQTSRSGPSNPYYDPQNDGHFVTDGFARRAIQTTVTLGSSNGSITVGSA